MTTNVQGNVSGDFAIFGGGASVRQEGFTISKSGPTTREGGKVEQRISGYVSVCYNWVRISLCVSIFKFTLVSFTCIS